jgi:hypothetical protein
VRRNTGWRRRRIEFTPEDCYEVGRRDSQTHFVPSKADNLDGYIVADDDFFVDFAGQHKHDLHSFAENGWLSGMGEAWVGLPLRRVNWRPPAKCDRNV